MSIKTFVLFFALSTSAQAQIPQVFQSWLGCWEFYKGDTLYRECWRAESPGLFRGLGLNLLGNDTLFKERITLNASAEAVYYTVSGADSDPNKAVRFTCTNWSGGEIIFENPEHDFPQHIVYRKSGADSLEAYIEGLIQNEKFRMNFPYRRSKARW